jgi:hypothetical protein
VHAWITILCTLVGGYQFRRETYFSIFRAEVNIEEICSSETFLTTYQTTLCRNSEDRNMNFHHRENLISHITFWFVSVDSLAYSTLVINAVIQFTECVSLDRVLHSAILLMLPETAWVRCKIYSLFIADILCLNPPSTLHSCTVLESRDFIFMAWKKCLRQLLKFKLCNL